MGETAARVPDKEGTEAGNEIRNCRIRALEKAGATNSKLFRELCAIAFSDIADYITVSEGGEVSVHPTSTIPPKKRKAIKKIREKRRILTTPGSKDKPDGEQILDQTTEYELYDKLESLKYLCRLKGLEIQKMELTGKDGAPINHKFTGISDEELLAIATSGRSPRGDSPKKG